MILALRPESSIPDFEHVRSTEHFMCKKPNESMNEMCGRPHIEHITISTTPRSPMMQNSLDCHVEITLLAMTSSVPTHSKNQFQPDGC